MATTKWIKVGSIVKTKNGKKSLKLIADVKVIKEALDACFKNEKGEHFLSIFEPNENAPEFVLGDVSVAVNEQ